MTRTESLAPSIPSPRHPDIEATPRARVDVVDLRPGDTSAVRAVFDGLSETSRMLRFHGGTPTLSAAALRTLSAVDPDRHVVHVAQADGQPVGLVRWIRHADRPEVAEVAIEVVDAHHRRGIGRTLLRAASESARRAGVRVFLAYVSGENAHLRRHLWSMGARPDLVEQDALAFRVPWDQPSTLPRPNG
jgi:L-amino acid N-acyltransferase YncA